MLSYTISTRNNLFQSLTNQTFQIMPTRTGLLNSLKFLENTKNESNILLHTGYDVHPFQQEIFNPASYQVQLLKSYFEACQRLKVKQLLIHGPDKPESMNYLVSGLTVLKSYLDNFNSLNRDYKLQICIEMPAFCQSMFRYFKTSNFDLNKIYEFVKSYFNEVVKIGFEIVIDTAHLFSNGLTTEQMIELIEIFKNNYTFIHLNGNAHQSFKKDKHTTLTPCEGFDMNLIPNSDKILMKVSEMMKLGKICISEQKCGNVKYFSELSKQYDFKLNDSIGINELII